LFQWLQRPEFAQALLDELGDDFEPTYPGPRRPQRHVPLAQWPPPPLSNVQFAPVPSPVTDPARAPLPNLHFAPVPSPVTDTPQTPLSTDQSSSPGTWHSAGEPRDRPAPVRFVKKRFRATFTKSRLQGDVDARNQPPGVHLTRSILASMGEARPRLARG
jgi:hypothetical protein